MKKDRELTRCRRIAWIPQCEGVETSANFCVAIGGTWVGGHPSQAQYLIVVAGFSSLQTLKVKPN